MTYVSRWLFSERCSLKLNFDELYMKVKVGNDQEIAQSKRNSHTKNRGGKN